MWYKKSKKKSDSKKLIDKLDAIFSQFIRLRDSNDKGLCRCITSGQIDEWKAMDAGHFISRNHMATRWEEKNVHAQSRKDNRFLGGRQYEHSLAIDKKYGEGTAEKLLIQSKQTKKFADFELEELIKYYTEQVKQLKKEKCL